MYRERCASDLYALRVVVCALVVHTPGSRAGATDVIEGQDH